MKEKNIEEILTKEFLQMGEMPDNIEKYIKNISLKEDKINRTQFIVNFIIKFIAILGICSCGTVCAMHYIDKHSNVYDTGVKKAMEDGYVYELDKVDYINDNNFKVGISSLLLDDYNFYLDMSIELENNLNIEGYENFEIKDIIIYDDKNNIYYADNYNMIDKFLKENNITVDDIKELGGSKGITISNVYKNTGTINFMLKESNNKYPESKEIFVEFREIKFSNNIDNTKQDIKLTGKWKNKIDVPKEFQNRESVNYEISNCNERINKDQFRIEVTETGTKLNMAMKWGDYEYWKNKTDKIRQYDVMGSRYIQAEKCYIENENGDKFYATFEGTGSRLNTDGTLLISCNFSFNKNNCTDNIKIVLVDINNENIEIKLNK